MRRRSFLAAVAGSVASGGFAGCVANDALGSSTAPTATPSPNPTGPSSPGAEQSSTASPGKPKDTPTVVRKTADGVAATFRVVGSRGHPIEETLDATFDGGEVTVTGSVDPDGCNEPTLSSVEYDASSGRIHLVVGEYSPYGETATIECGNAIYDFRSVVTVEEGEPSVVEVRYDHPTREDSTFTVARD